MKWKAAAISLLLCCLTAGAGVARAQTKTSVDIIVAGPTIVTMDAARRVIEDGAIAVEHDSIAAVGKRPEIEAKYSAARRIDATGKLLLPGLINGHNHAPMTLFRGLKDDVTLREWLEKYIFPAEAKNVDEEFVRWGTRLAALEMIRGGTTTYADMYYFEDAVAEETRAAGMRGVLGETVIDFPAPDNKSPLQTFEYIERFLKKWKGDPLIRAAVAPHSIYTDSEKTLRDSAALARKYAAPILIHLAESRHEMDVSREKYAMSPVAFLDKIGLLGPEVIAAHCIFVDAADQVRLAKRGVGCVHNPSSNMMLASGVAPVVEMRKAGIAVGLGTDGPAGSNNDLDLMEEMDLAAKLQKVTRMDPQALGAKAALEMATIEGARALHMDKEAGSLEPGKKADFIFISLADPHAVPMYDLYSQIVYALKGSDVDTVVIAGKVLMQDRQILTLDEKAIIAKAKEYGRRVRESLRTGR